MGKNKDLIKAVLILCVFALISGALLGLFHQITLITDKEKEQRIVKKLQDIHKSDNYEKIEFDKEKFDKELIKNIQYFFEDKTAGIYVIIATGEKGYKDKIPMYVIIKNDEIIALKEGSMSETPGASDFAFSNNYLNNFLKPVSELNFSKDPDITTGATYSRRSILSSIQNAVNFYIQYKKINVWIKTS